MGDLNTSHVKVNLGGFATWDEFLQAFKIHLMLKLILKML